MAEHICPWWLGRLLANPVRRLWQDPAKILTPYVSEGMTVLEPGPGMGFFTLELARRVGASGRVIAVDTQPQMLKGLRRRTAKAGVAERIDARLVQPESMGLADVAGQVDFTLLFAMVHETGSPRSFFAEVAQAMKPGGRVLFVEPRGHVDTAKFESEIALATDAGLTVTDRPPIRLSHSAVLTRTCPVP